MKRAAAFTVVALAAWGMFSAQAQATVVTVKANWDVGTLTQGGQTFNLTYRDAHVKFATKGFIQDSAGVTTEDNGFPPPNKQIVHGPPGTDDCLIIDWVSPTDISGTHHLGAEFDVDNLGQPTDIRTVEARLTNVSGTGVGGGSFSSLPTLPVPGPQSITWKKANSADVTFSHDNVGVSGPITFSDVEFFKLSSEPALADLNAVDFASLGATSLGTVPDFVLSPGGTMDFNVPGIDPPEWLIVFSTQTWEDPLLTSLMPGGGPVTVSVNTWSAGPMTAEAAIPEPAAGVLLLGTLGLVFPGLVPGRRHRVL